MTQINNGNYDYHQAYSYTGNSGARHYVHYLVYVPAGRSTSTNQYGYAGYNEVLARFSCTTRSRDCGPKFHEWTNKDDGMEYRLDMSYCSGRHVWSCAKLASMNISNIYANDVSEPYTMETISIDISNSGGDGNYSMELLDGEVVLCKSSNKRLEGNSSARETFEFFMLDKDTELTISLIDDHTGEIIDEAIHTVTIPTACTGVVCEPLCFGTDLYETVCEDGVCIQGTILSADDVSCAQEIPDFSDFIDNITNADLIAIVAISAVGSVLVVRQLT